ncbi:hypothetical protein LZL87_011720 [Fusarium oxysporum]|nr:hypothetical protein LZL87_011720 [Fusarium oxysporum]
MSSLKIPEFIYDQSFDTQPRAPNDPTGVPEFPAEEGCGDDFQPFNIKYRDFQINPLPQQPLELFQLFVPISLVQSWIEYTNSWVAHLLENAVIDNWNTPLSKQSRILKWEGISISTAYKTPRLGDQRPLHSFTKFMPLQKFQLITRYFRTFDYTKLDVRDEGDIPRTFQAAEEWSNHIQRVSIELYNPGTNLTVDECMVLFTGRSKETTVVKNKPTPVGFKVWVIAQQGYFLQWLWHIKASPYQAVIVELPIPTPYGKKGKLRTEIPLSNTQSIVVHLLKRLSTQTHHVFTDNLFSSPQLFRLLRQLGHGATGTARPNCGITTEMKHIKETGKAPNGTALGGIVLFLSTVLNGASHEYTLKKRKLRAKRGTKAEAKRLQQVFNGDTFKTIAAQYNDEMNYVDRGDQIRSYTTYEHRFRRGPWQALLWSFLLEVALANSFILQKKIYQPHWQPYGTLQAWKECIYNAIFNKYGTDSFTRKRYCTGKEEERGS